MTPIETVALVRQVRATCPAQRLDEYTPDAWHPVLADLRFHDCNLAVIELAKRLPFISPAEIRQEVRRIRKDRLDRTTQPIPPSDMTPVQTIAWQRRVTREIADGTYVPPVLVGTRPMPAIEGTFRRVDDVIAETRAVLHQEAP